MTVLAQKARLSVAWTTGLNVLRDATQFGLMLVLVRLLPVEAYGQFGLINTIVGFMMVFSSREFIAHTLLVRDDREVNYQEQFTAGCVIQGTLFIAANIAAVVLRYFPTYAPVAPLLHVMSISFLLDLPSELRTKMLERSLDWRRLRTIEACGIVGSAALTLGLALAGANVYALLIPAFTIPAAFAFDLFVIARWRPTFGWHAGRYQASRAFGVKRVLSVSFVSASNLLESSVLAKAVGYAMLGIFGRAFGMATLFCQRIASLLMSALYPVLARIPPRSEAYRRGSALVLRVVAWLVIPIATLVSLLADRIVGTLYGTRWMSVIPLVPWAMAVGALLAVVQAAYSLLLAHQEPRKCLYADVWRLAGMAAGLLIALPFGLPAYIGSLIIVHGVAFGLVTFWLAQSGGVDLKGIVSAIVPAAAATVLSAIAAEVTRALLLRDMPAIPLMAIYGIVFGGTYLGSLRLFFAPLLHELVGYLPEARRVNRLLGFAQAA